MNNSVEIQEQEEQKPDFAERAGHLTTLIESINSILDSKEWSTLKEEFDVERYKRILLAEGRKRPINEPEIYFLQGKIDAMERYDLERMRDKFLKELESIRKLA